MNIISLGIENVKRISAIELHPETGEPIILTGDNAQGKSSVLDSIELLLTNKGLDDPIRHGRTSGKVTAVIGGAEAEFTVERKVTRSGQSLTITGKDGVKVPSPQTFLNGLLGKYTFDPLAFVALKPKEQVEALKIAAGLDFTALDAERLERYDERTRVGQRGKEVAGQLAGATEPLPGTPEEEVSAVDAMKELEVMNIRVRRVDEVKRNVELAAGNVSFTQAEIDKLRKSLANAEAQLSKQQTTLAQLQTELSIAAEEAPTKEELEALSTKIAGIDKTNASVREAREYRRLKGEDAQLRTDYKNLSDQIAQIDANKADKIKKANLPLDGLELTDDGVFFNGTLFTQLSTAEQIRISTLVAMAQNPTLKIVFVREGALVNRANLAMMFQLARERGCQMFVEKFSESPEDNSLHIIDGQIAFVKGQPVETPVAAEA